MLPKIELSETSLRKNNLTNKIHDALGDKLFTIKSWNGLIYNSLKLIHPINNRVSNNTESIADGCKLVNIHLGLNKKARLRNLRINGGEEIFTPEEDDITKYKKYVLQLDRLPWESLELISHDVKTDLLNITLLIDRYEQRPPILNFKRKGEIPKNHEGRTIFDFYQRCVKERVEIMDYYLKNMKDRALEKSRFSLFSNITLYLEAFYDRPYYYSRPYSEVYYDIDLLDLVGHRIDEMSYYPNQKLSNLYSKNKDAFYRLYFKKIPIAKHFQSFDWYLANLPLQNNRQAIFEELKELFQSRKWIGFYALALPQLEGLFSEMCRAIDPDDDMSQKSLTAKVNAVRPFHSMSRSYFDYYQYHIPLLRNKFAHTGYDENFKLKAFDLLADLMHLLKIFFELDNPLVKVKQLHVKRDPYSFISINDFSEYFELVEQLKPKQKKEIAVDLIKFEKEFLVEECSLDYTITQLYTSLPKMVKEFTEWIYHNLKYEGIEFEIETLNWPDIQEFLGISNHMGKIEILYITKSEEYENLKSNFSFLKGYKKNLPSLGKKSSELLAALYKDEYRHVEKLIKIKGAFPQTEF